MEPKRALGVVDVVFLSIATVLSMALVGLRSLWVPSVGLMLQDFGGRLPRVTRLALGWELTLYAIGAAALLVTLGLWRRRASLTFVAAAVVGAAIGLTIWGMYAPLYALSGAIAP